VGLGVEHQVVAGERWVRAEQEIEVLERLGEEEAVLEIALLLGHHALERRVAVVGAAVRDEVSNRPCTRRVERVH
jgi:hypothetical protein